MGGPGFISQRGEYKFDFNFFLTFFLVLKGVFVKFS